jgi:hypothetical protein
LSAVGRALFLNGAPLVLLISYLMAKLLAREPPDLRALFRQQRRGTVIEVNRDTADRKQIEDDQQQLSFLASSSSCSRLSTMTSRPSLQI